MAFKVRIGIVGCGRVARAHLEGYRRCGARVTAVTDVNRERAAEWAAELGAVAFEGSGELAASGLVDAVDICSPPAAHPENFAAVAEHVRHIFLEKPMAADLAGCHEIMAVAARTGVQAMTGFFHRYHEPLLSLKELLAAGKLGDVVALRNRFVQLPDPAGARPWLYDKQVAGGGILVHTSSHAVDLFRFLVGEVASITAFTGQVDRSVTLEDIGVILVRSEQGAVGILEAYGNMPFMDYAAELQGTLGEARVGYFPPRLQYRFRGDAGWTDADLQESEPRHRVYKGMEAFVAQVRSGTEPSPSLADGLRSMELITAAYSSAATGRTVETPASSRR